MVDEKGEKMQIVEEGWKRKHEITTWFILLARASY
jgi:hypothetical protein